MCPAWLQEHKHVVDYYMLKNMNIDSKSALYVSITRAWEKPLRSKMRMLTLYDTNSTALQLYSLVFRLEPFYHPEKFVKFFVSLNNNTRLQKKYNNTHLTNKVMHKVLDSHDYKISSQRMHH
jgi:hypothetical protein